MRRNERRMNSKVSQKNGWDVGESQVGNVLDFVMNRMKRNVSEVGDVSGFGENRVKSILSENGNRSGFEGNRIEGILSETGREELA